MMSERILGRTLRSTTSMFTFGCTEADPNLPAFGVLVRVLSGTIDIYGLVYEVVIQDDPFVRQVVAASASLSDERIQDMRERRQIPVEISALVIAYRQGGQIYQRIPPQPPGALQPIFLASEDEVRQVLSRHDYFRSILNSPVNSAEELLAATLRHAAASLPDAQRQSFLIDAGRQLAALLALDPMRLDAILRRLSD